jgi:IS30 family transposase
MAEAHATGHYTLRAIAAAFGVHEATVSRVLRRSSIPLEAGS